MEEKYVFDNMEVVKTGRKAIKDKPTKANRSDRTPTKQDDVLYEITPADKENGSWKKWVRNIDLYRILEQKEVN